MHGVRGLIKPWELNKIQTYPMSMQKKDSIIVIGDVMIDCYWHTEVVRVSPEAPVLIVEDRWREYRLGGAANVAANCVSIGATVVLGSVVGDDENGKK